MSLTLFLCLPPCLPPSHHHSHHSQLPHPCSPSTKPTFLKNPPDCDQLSYTTPLIATVTIYSQCMHAFSAFDTVGRQEGHPARKKTEWWSAGVVICLERGADLHTAQLMPLPLTVSCFTKIQIGFCYQLTWVVTEKGPLNGCVCLYDGIRVRTTCRVVSAFGQLPNKPICCVMLC